MRFQPQGTIRLNRSNPLTRGLVAAYVPRSGPRDATGTLATLVDVAPVASSLGYVTPPLNVGPYPVVGTFPFLRTDPISAFVLGRFAISNDANGSPAVSVGQTGGSNGWKFGPLGTGGNLILTFISVADYSTSVQFPASGSIAFSATPGANARIFTNGGFRQQIGIGTPNNTLPTARMAIGQRGDANSDSTSGSQVALALYWNRALSDAEQASLAANPWQIFDAGSSSAYQAAIASVSPPVGGGATTLAPGPAALTLTGNAPAIIQPRALSPVAASLALAGFAPSVTQPQTLVPAGSTLALTGYAPQITQPQTLSPVGAGLTLTGYAPSLVQSNALQPSGAVLALTGYAPTIGQAVTLSPGTASLATTGYAPTVTQVAPVTLSPAGYALSLFSYAPSITQGAQVAPPVIDGGGAGPVREVRRFADLLDKVHKPSRSQKKARRMELEAEALELLPDLPEAERLAPIVARMVYEQEARALAPLYANRPVEALQPVEIPFDAHAALRELVNKLLDEALEQQKVAEDEENDIELLLFGT